MMINADSESEGEEEFSITKGEWIRLKNSLFTISMKLDKIMNGEKSMGSVPQSVERSHSGSVSSITSYSSGAPESVRFLELSGRQSEVFKESTSDEIIDANLNSLELFMRILEPTFPEWLRLR